MDSSVGLNRRHVITGAAALGVGVPVMAACGGDSDDDDDAEGTPSAGKASGTIVCPCHGSRYSAADGSVVQGPAGGPLKEKTAKVVGTDVEVDGEVLTAVADVPVGGGTVVSDAKTVVTQPEEGVFKAFTAVCTHQGCLVDKVTTG